MREKAHFCPEILKKRPFGIARRKRDDNIKIDLKCEFEELS
jgi:hypothetical protein